MKVGIIGLYPRQVNDIRNRNFGEIELSFLDNGRSLTAAKASRFTAGLDRVFLMQQNLPQHVINAIPLELRVMHLGAVSSLARALEELAGIEPSEDEEVTTARPAKKAPKKTKVAPVAKTATKSNPTVRSVKVTLPRNTLGDSLAQVLESAGQLLASDVPDGRRSEYVKPEDKDFFAYQVENLKHTEFAVIPQVRKASVGEVIRFTKPGGEVEFSAWRQENQLVAATLRHRFDIVTEMHFYPSFVDYVVMTPFETKINMPERKAERIDLATVRAAYDSRVREIPVIVKPSRRIPTASELDIAPIAEETTTVETAPVVVVEPVVTLPKDVLAPTLLAADVPEGRRSQYWLPEGDVLINFPNSGGVQSYTILEATQPGDVLRFARPQGLELAKWRSRVASTRHYWWTRKNVLLEAHFYDEYVDFKVMEPNERKVPANTLNRTYQRTQPVNEPRDMGTTTDVEVETDGLAVKATGLDGGSVICDVHKESEATTVQPEFDFTDDDVQDQAQAAPVVPNPDAETEALGESANIAEFEMLDHVGPEVKTFATTTKVERKFWRIIYMGEFDVSGDVDTAATKADAALKAYRDRFN